MDDNRSYAAVVFVAVFLLLLPSLYVGSYLALLGNDSDPLAFDYPYGGRMAERFYRPINWVDRRLRPNYPRWRDSRTEIHVDYIEVKFVPSIEDWQNQYGEP